MTSAEFKGKNDVESKLETELVDRNIPDDSEKKTKGETDIKKGSKKQSEKFQDT